MIIAVASGKGGTGKTLVSSSLALSLKDEQQVQVLDCDVEEPNAHIFLKPTIRSSKTIDIPVPKIDEERCNHIGKCAEICAFNAISVTREKIIVFPELCHGCGACIYLCPENAIYEVRNKIGTLEIGDSDGLSFVGGRLSIGQPMSPPIIRAVKNHAQVKGVVIIDVPPGTSCPVVESIKDSDFCLLVTEPTPFGFNDLVLAIDTVRLLGIPFGIVLNKAGIGDGKVDQYCKQNNIPIILTIPFDAEIASLYSRGIPLVEGKPQWKESFRQLFVRIKDKIDERNSNTKR